MTGWFLYATVALYAGAGIAALLEGRFWPGVMLIAWAVGNVAFAMSLR